MRTLCNEVCLKEVSEELGLPLNTVRKIVGSQSEYTRSVIESGTFDKIRWAYLGAFVSKPKEVQMINHMRGLSDEQRKEFRKAVLTGRIKFNWWEKKNANRTEDTERSDSDNGASGAHDESNVGS